MGKSIKIPVLHYEEITDTVQLNDLEINGDRYITTEGGRQWLVEVWG